MRSSSSLSPRVIGVSLFVLTLIALTGNALVHSTYLGSRQGGKDRVRVSVSNGNARNSGTATLAATLLTQFSQQGPKLVGTGAVGNARQGYSVSLSSDGNTAIVGGFDNNFTGAAWVWTRSGGVWTQQGNKLVGSGAPGGPAGQGISVSLSADGNTAIVGGNTDNNYAGAAWVWTRSGGVWTQQGNKLVGSGGLGCGAQQGKY
jgi:hypothetical protein